MARPLVLAAALVLAQLGSAVAAPAVKTSKVTIETEPPGAKVYFGLKEDGEVCTTPCTIDAPIGENAIIVEAENRRSLMENLVVKRSARTMRVVYKLEPAIGTLVVEGGNGATIRLDEEDAGKAPRRIDNVIAGGHHVVLEKNGRTIYDDFIDVEAGNEATITVPAITAAPPAAPREELVATVPAPRRTLPVIAVAAAMDFGFRQFTYLNNATPKFQRDHTIRGQVLTGASVELWPTRLLGRSELPGLALYARFAYGINSQTVVIENPPMPTAMQPELTTSAQSLEISLHHRWAIANRGTIEVGGGYVDDRYRFEGMANDVAIVPDASYQAVRIGGRASLLFRQFEPYIALENRIVLHGGALEKRYTLGTSVYGVHGAIGGAMHIGKLEVRLEGSITRYRWTFTPDTTMDAALADGGSDVIENITLAVGYSY